MGEEVCAVSITGEVSLFDVMQVLSFLLIRLRFMNKNATKYDHFVAKAQVFQKSKSWQIGRKGPAFYILTILFGIKIF